MSPPPQKFSHCKLGSAESLEVINLYLTGLGTTEIGPMYGVSDETIRQLLIRFNVPKRSKSQAIKLAWARDRSKRSGENHPGWRGGRWVNYYGYIMIYKPDYPHADNNGYVREHVFVLEKKLGRFIGLHENSHHINGIKTDNRPENLEVMTIGEHTSLHNLRRKKT